MKLQALLVFTFCYLVSVNGQDTIQVAKSYPHAAFITAGTLITSGVFTNKSGTKEGFRDFVRKRLDVHRTSIDDYLQHSPILFLGIHDLVSRPSKQEINRQLRHLIVTQTANIATVLILKELSGSTRPNGGSRAFPSGHTAYAFANAQVLYHSLKDRHPVLAYSGYIPAFFTGIYRILKDKHWISDVLAGAGIGILFSQLTYHFDIWNARTHNKKRQTDSHLSVGLGSQGVGLTFHF